MTEWHMFKKRILNFSASMALLALPLELWDLHLHARLIQKTFPTHIQFILIQIWSYSNSYRGETATSARDFSTVQLPTHFDTNSTEGNSAS
jgi:hypothetical protein